MHAKGIEEVQIIPETVSLSAERRGDSAASVLGRTAKLL